MNKYKFFVDNFKEIKAECAIIGVNIEFGTDDNRGTFVSIEGTESQLNIVLTMLISMMTVKFRNETPIISSWKYISDNFSWLLNYNSYVVLSNDNSQEDTKIWEWAEL